MQILFIHQNFPAQFKFLAPALVAAGYQVFALRLDQQLNTVQRRTTPEGIELVTYPIARGNGVNIHPWLLDFETKTIRAEACLRAAQALEAQGLQPAVIIAHPGWGESLFLKQLWPQARLGIYCEFFYQLHGFDSHFDPEFPPPKPLDYACHLQLKNLNYQAHFASADAGLAPTHFQASSFPAYFREKITVCHDGIDTQTLGPNPNVTLDLSTATGESLHLSRKDAVITFVNRNLEPYRGYHTFMRALPKILHDNPRAQVLIVGGDETGYGAAAPQGNTWKQHFIAEVHPQIPASDWQRVNFLGRIPYPHFIALLQLSRVHIYLSYPFILSWSLLEAMSIGCAIIASDTAAVREVIKHQHTGLLVDFFKPQSLAKAIKHLLAQAKTRQRLGGHARAFVKQHYDLNKVCLPQQLQWVEQLIKH